MSDNDLFAGEEDLSLDNSETPAGGAADPAPAPDAGAKPQDAADAGLAGNGEGEGQHVPLGALRAVREENKTLKAKAAEADTLREQLAALQAAPAQQPAPQAPQPPSIDDQFAALDPLDPDYSRKVAGFVAEKTRQVAIATRLETSQEAATREFGADVVKAAFEYFNTRPYAESAALLNERSPFHAAVAAHKKALALAEIGEDPAAYRERLREEVRAELLGASGQQAPIAKPTTGGLSLAGETNLGGRSTQEWAGPSSLDEILGL